MSSQMKELASFQVFLEDLVGVNLPGGRGGVSGQDKDGGEMSF